MSSGSFRGNSKKAPLKNKTPDINQAWLGERAPIVRNYLLAAQAVFSRGTPSPRFFSSAMPASLTDASRPWFHLSKRSALMHSFFDKFTTLAVAAFALLIVGLATRARDSSPRSWKNASIFPRHSAPNRSSYDYRTWSSCPCLRSCGWR